MPGRLYLNGASEVACLHTQQGKKGTNQDAMLVWEVLHLLFIEGLAIVLLFKETMLFAGFNVILWGKERFFMGWW